MDQLGFGEGGEDDVILTRAQVERWLEEHDILKRQAADIQSRVATVEQKLSAAEVLLGRPLINRGGASSDSESAGDDDGSENMAEATLRIAQERGVPLTNQQLVSALREIPEFAERLDRNPNYFYTMISRLAKRGALVKDGGTYRHP